MFLNEAPRNMNAILFLLRSNIMLNTTENVSPRKNEHFHFIGLEKHKVNIEKGFA